MKVRLIRVGGAVLGCAAAILSSVAVASADPPDPHLPDLANNYCPGAQWIYGSLVSVDGGSGQRQMCDGVLYPDGSYWHEWTWEHGVFGTEWHHDCVSGSSAFPVRRRPAAVPGQFRPRNPSSSLSRRAVLGGALAGSSFIAMGGTASARTPVRVLIATNEPWGTYHVQPLLAEADRRGWQLIQLVPDLPEIAPDHSVRTVLPDSAPCADLLVITGAGDWSAECAARFCQFPLAASSLAYLEPEEAPLAKQLRPRLHTITSSSAAESRAFGVYLGSRRKIEVVGSPATDALPRHTPQPDLVLVLTSVTHADDTGDAAPGTELLLAAAQRLQDAGKRILVGLHPREDPALWSQYEISDLRSVQASACAEAAIGIPGTVFPLIAATGTPVVGCTDPALTVPDYLLSVCSSTIDDAAQAVSAVDGAELPDAQTLLDAVGPVGGSAHRLLDAWSQAFRGPR